MVTKYWGGLFAVAALFAMACSDEGLDGPEREAFDAVQRVSLDVEHGEVTVYASNGVEGAIIDRWISAESDFSQLSQRLSGSELIVDAQCNTSGGCESRYDLAVEPDTEVEIRMATGDANIYRLRGGLDVAIDEGELRTNRLESPFVFAALHDGASRLHFDEPPGELRLTVGETASVTVVIPNGRYRCDFDIEAESIGADDLDCHGQVGEVLRVLPSDASVRFVVTSSDR